MKITLAFRNFTKTKISQTFLEKIAFQTLKFLKTEGKIELSLALVGAKRIKALNKKYRKISRITDVLAFGESPAKKDGFVEPPDKVRRLGEIIICLDAARTQAKIFGHPFKKELAILLVHGILHLLGWSDETSKEKKRMQNIEKKLYETF